MAVNDFLNVPHPSVLHAIETIHNKSASTNTNVIVGINGKLCKC